MRGVDSATPNIRAAHECPRDARILDSLRESELIFLDSSMVEHAAVNRGVVGSSPTRGAQFFRPGGQEVKTSPFHGGNTGSIPVRVTDFLFRY